MIPLVTIQCAFFCLVVTHWNIERIITNDQVEGVPILMLANKQDVDGALRVEEIKEVFNRIAVKLGARDSRVLPVSALTGYGYKTWIKQEANDGCLLERA